MPEQPKLPPRKPVELPPIDRTPVDDTSNAAYSALTPRQHAADSPAEKTAETPAEGRAVAVPSESALGEAEADPAVAHVQATATAPASVRPTASARSTSTGETTGLGLSRVALVVSVLLSLTAALLAIVLSAATSPSPFWPLYLGASIGAVSVLLAVLARRHRGWIIALLLSAAVVVGCISFAFVVA
ncbi:hypothetical protein C5B85_11860 [Pseudoclavibacter sp. AY1F1]|nr:hypothetical protein C5B85_11860 [Pseudoclavibacter sp. AY1F1]